MKNISIIKNIIIILVYCIITFSLSTNASAQDLSYNLSSTIIPVVSDKAGILTDYEEVTILNKFTELRDASSFQFIFMTVTDTDEYTRGNELEAMYNMHVDDLYGTGTVLFLISTDNDNLICEVQAYNDAKYILSHEVCSYISRELENYIKEGNYFDGVMKFFDYYNQANDGTLTISDESKQADYNSIFSYMKTRITFTILLATVSLLITALLYVFIFALKNKSPKTNAPGKIPQESDIFVGNISYKYKLTSDRITYIRSRVTK